MQRLIGAVKGSAMPKTKSGITLPPDTYQDNGRRGEPKLGCDCVQCFGMCLLDPEVVLREQRNKLCHVKEAT